jgi:NAD(P)-dependent dehydrogenase (short-subunit alcohol dehydrogenase family)
MQNPSVLLVTGASRGIGAATALLAARQGWAVAVNYLGHSLAADEVVRAIRAEGGRAMAVQGNVALEADVLRLFAQVDAKLGPLTGLVNNAGVVDVACRVDAMSVERLQRQWSVNVLGSFVCAREAVRRMSTHHGGAGGVYRERVQRRIAAGCTGPVCGLCGLQRRHRHLYRGSGARGG